MRSRLRPARRQRGAGPHLPLRGAAPAALLLAAGLRRRAADADRVEARAARGRGPPQPARDRPGAAARPRLRDRVGQGQQRPPRRLRPGRARPAAGRSAGHDAETVAQVFAAYEEVKREPGPDGHGGRAAASPPACSPTTSGSPPRSAGSTSASSSTSSRTSSPLQSALLDLWLGGRDELCVVGDPAQTIYSFAGASRRYLRDFPAQVPRHHLDRAGPQLPLDARRWSPPPTRCWPARPAGASSCARSSPPVPTSTYRRQPRRGRRGRRRRRPDRRLARRGPAARRDRGAVPDQRPVRGLRGGARPSAASPTSCAAPRGSSTGPRCGRR